MTATKTEIHFDATLHEKWPLHRFVRVARPASSTRIEKVVKIFMKAWIAVSVVVILQFGGTGAFAQEPVVFDDSRAKEMQTVWIKHVPLSTFAGYMQNVADIPGNNLVAVLLNREYRTWPTTPLLDTTANSLQWINAMPYRFIEPFDYDGVPPGEFFTPNGSGNNAVIRPSADGKIMTCIDTVICLTPKESTGQYTRTDVDGDGTLDVVAIHSGDPWFKVLLAGAGHGQGCSRVIDLPNGLPDAVYNGYLYSNPMRVMRCADGKLRIVWTGTFGNGANSYRRGIYLLDVHLQKTDTGYAVSYTIADSITQRFLIFQGEETPWVIRPVVCVDDAKNGHQYALVSWQDGYHINHNTTVMYEVSNGKLVERLSTKGELLTNSTRTFDNTFDDGDAVIMYGRNFARVTEFHRPFAKLSPTVFASSMAFIDDQFNDGSRDLMAGTENSITLVNFDLQTTSVTGDEVTQPSWVSLSEGRLQLTLDQPSAISVEAVNSIGQKRPFIVERPALAGPFLLDVSQQLAALPKGAWFIRVSDGVRIVSLSYLR